MEDLIERLQKATGPDRRLDIEISCEVDGFSRVHFADVFAQATDDKLPPFDEEHWPLYTKSVDAALTLVPKDWAADVTAYAGKGLGDARVWSDGFQTQASTRTMMGRPANLAIALCIAALKARMVIKGEGEKVG